MMPPDVAPPLVSRLRAWLAAIPAEEIARQHALLSIGARRRAALTAFTYLLAAFILPVPQVLGLALVDYASERTGLSWMKGLDPARAPLRYLGTLAAIMASQLAYAVMFALSYQSNEPLAQVFAAGTMTLTLLQMGSIRVIHRPYALVGIVTCFVVAIIAVTIDWQSRSGPGGLILSYVAILAAAYFILVILDSNHVLHDSIARERAAARAANEAKSRFLAQMSHELRTPLNAILGLGHAELMQARDPASQQRLQLVTDAARGLAVMLDDILDMAAIEAGHLPIRPAPSDPAREIANAAALFQPLFAAQGLQLTVALSPDLPARSVMDAQRLRQCLSNLFSNALKHTRSGGVILTAAVDSDGRLAITVADTGAGIPASEAEQLFQPFRRGAGDTPGTGLGLSITRALARAMGGDLQLLPSASGAHFRLTLALQAPSESQPAAPPPPKPPDPMAGSGPRVLVVDDIATNRLVARAHLRLHGLVIDEAGSGSEAIERLRNTPPDLVFLDMNMPGMDGLATLKRIRTLPSRAARLPVIAMTADATEAHRRRYLEAGLDGYLSKPLTPEAVAEVLARFLPRPG